MPSNFEKLLQALLNGETVDIQPHSRMEAYLKNCCEGCGCDGLPEPVTRADALLYALAEKLAGGGTSEQGNLYKAPANEIAIWQSANFDNATTVGDTGLSVMSMVSENGYALENSTDGGKVLRVHNPQKDKGYMTFSAETLNRIKQAGGGTVVFKVAVYSTETPPVGQYSHIALFTNSANGYNFATYNFEKKAFTAGNSTQWISDGINDDNFTTIAATPFDWQPNIFRWYEMAVRFNGNKIEIYLDGELMLSSVYDNVCTEYIIFYPQYCSMYIDDICVYPNSYSVTGKVGEYCLATDTGKVYEYDNIGVWEEYKPSVT